MKEAANSSAYLCYHGSKEDILNDPRFRGIEPFHSRIWLSSPTMHGEEQRWVDEAIQTNWVSTVGANIDGVFVTNSEVGEDNRSLVDSDRIDIDIIEVDWQAVVEDFP